MFASGALRSQRLTEITRAAKILQAMEIAHSSHKGAVGLLVNGRDEMIDAPMLRQVRDPYSIPRSWLAIVRTTPLNTAGATNHSTRKASRVTHLQLININVEVSVSNGNMKAGRRANLDSPTRNAMESTLEDLNDSVTTPGGRSFRSPWAFFFHPLPVVRGLWACSNAERLSVKFSVSMCACRDHRQTL